MAPSTASPQAYRQSAVLSASPGELVVMLYDAARRFLRQASIAMEEGEVERAHNTLRRAELIIAQLDGTLDLEQGQISERLHAIYQFCLAHLNRGRMGQDTRMLEAVSSLLGELREAWTEVAERPKVVAG
jgi:flagellar protein FliS